MNFSFKIFFKVYDAEKWQNAETAYFYGNAEHADLIPIDDDVFETDIDFTRGNQPLYDQTSSVLRGVAWDRLGRHCVHYPKQISVTAEIFSNDDGKRLYDTWFYLSFRNTEEESEEEKPGKGSKRGLFDLFRDLGEF